MKYLLDNNILSEPTKLQPDQNVLKQLELKGIFACTCAVVWNELWYGIHRLPNRQRQAQLAAYLNLLAEDGLVILPFDYAAAEWLAQEQVRLEHVGTKPAQYDSLIAAIAAVNNLTLVTRNTKDFIMFEDLRVENWF